MLHKWYGPETAQNFDSSVFEQSSQWEMLLQVQIISKLNEELKR